MKKVYLKPNAEFVNLVINESLTALPGGQGGVDMSSPDDYWDED